MASRDLLEQVVSCTLQTADHKFALIFNSIWRLDDNLQENLILM